MKVELRPRVCGGHVVVALTGELDTTDASTAAAAVAALAPGGHLLIIDLEGLGFIDCHALGALLGVRRMARQAGGDVLLAAPRGAVLRVLTLFGVPGVHASVAAATHSAPAAPPGLLPASQRPAHRRTGGTAAWHLVPDDGREAAGLMRTGHGYAASGPAAGPRR